MNSLSRSVLATLVALASLHGAPASAASDTDSDALSLESAPEASTAPAASDTRMYVEGAVGNSSQRYQSGSIGTARASFDFSTAASLGPGLRAVFSDRVDHLYPAPSPGADATVNSLRETYLSWQPQSRNTVLEFGRINLRYGPGYGYNPTDYFRDGALRVVTTADPFALRENRQGSVMLRAQRLWSGGSLSVAFSPKLADAPNTDGWNPDLGSTNHRNRTLVALGTQWSQRVSSQLFLYKDAALSTSVGANMTALLSDAAVAHLEWTRSKEPDLLSRISPLPSSTTSTRNRFVGGATYTTASKLSVTAEYEYNGFALSQSNWAALGPAPAAQLAYLGGAVQLQELPSRQAYLVYVTQKDLWLKNLDLTAYLRFNPDDSSRLAWVELRHHWSKFDLTLQLQQNIGSATSDFGILPDRRLVQVLGTYYF
ncbi:MAG: hypothetical protein EPN61_01035 [Burkholderiaceae bacterium]|nr:MAG: hypothetical protein EPN61_01035 [Burkholderiaceae bacterium]